MCTLVTERVEGRRFRQFCQDTNCAYRKTRTALWIADRKAAWLKDNRKRAVEKLKRVDTAMCDLFGHSLMSTHPDYADVQAGRKIVTALRKSIELELKIEEEAARKDWL